MRAATPLLPRKRGPAPYSGTTQFEITTTTTNQAMSFNILAGSTPNLIVNWGDGSAEETFVSTGTKSHTYATAGVRTMTMRGSCYGFNFNTAAGKSALTALLTPIGQITGLVSVSTLFTDCTKITSIPSRYFARCQTVTSFASIFQGCTGITTIPGDLFEGVNGSAYSQCFYGCTNITSIPSGLFDGQTNATNFQGAFQKCTKLVSIPEGLFTHCPKVTTFLNTFSSATAITALPSTMFCPSPTATSTVFTTMFSGCTNMAGAIPSGFFDGQIQGTAFGGVFQTCSKLTSIPSGLFDDCAGATDFSSIFNSCSGITSSIPSGLFANCPAVTNFGSVFAACTKLTGVIPADLFCSAPTATSTSFGYAFYSTGVSGEIPSGLFANYPNGGNFLYTFSACPNLTSIPANLFSACPKNLTYQRCFYNSTGITALPATLFPSTPTAATISFVGAFEGCTGLDGAVPATLFGGQTPATSMAQCFKGCNKLDSVASGTFDALSNVTTFAECFMACSQLTSIPSGLFANCPKVTTFSSTFSGSALATIPLMFSAAPTAATITMDSMFASVPATAIPSGLLINQTPLTNVSNMFMSSGITSIPEGLFASQSGVLYFIGVFQSCLGLTALPTSILPESPTVAATTVYFTSMFESCTNLAGTIPPAFFNAYVGKILRVNRLFAYDTPLTGSSVQFWNFVPPVAVGANDVNTKDCYHNCTNLSDYATIPSSFI